MPRARKLRGDSVALEAAAWFFENSLDALLITRHGVVERVSPAWTTLTGWTEAETVGRAILDTVHPDDALRVLEGVRVLETEGEVGYDLRVLASSSQWLWVRVRARRAADGSSLVILKDIGEELRKAEEAETLRRAGESLALSAGIYTWRFDPEAGVFENSPDFSRPFRETPSERRLPATTLSDSVHPEDLPALGEPFQRTLTTGSLETAEYRYLHEGQLRHVRGVWAGSQRLASGAWEVIGVNQDLTELMVERDRAQAAALAKSRFLANISHEIRTPMNGVLGILHLLRGARREQDRMRLIDEALASGSTLSQLLGDIVAFSDIEEGRYEVRPEPTDLDALVQGVVALHRDQARAKGLFLTCASPDAGWALVDGGRLRQLLFNLVGNALKFTLRGGVEIRIGFEGQGEARCVTVEIEDTGVGIAAAAQDNLFEPFHQVDGDSTRRFGGTGLGLAIAQRLARLMGGDLTFVSREGEGSTFRLEVAAPLAAPPQAQPMDDGWLAGLRVLVVEDNPTNRLVATRMLGQLGAEVITAEDGLQGVEAAGREAFDLIFMDIQMPVMDGIEATRRIRALDGPSAHAPIVAVTANVLSQQVDSYRACGMNGCVAKPISPAALLSELSKLTENAANAA